MAIWLVLPKKPTFVFFSLVWKQQKLHYDSKYETIFEKIPNFPFLLLALSFYPG